MKIAWAKESVILGCSFVGVFAGVNVRAQKCLGEWSAEAWDGDVYVEMQGCKSGKHAARMARKLACIVAREVHGFVDRGEERAQ